MADGPAPDTAPESPDGTTAESAVRGAGQGSHEPGPAPESRRVGIRGPPGAPRPPRRTLGLVVAFLAPCAVIALSILSIVRDVGRQRPSTPASPLPAVSAAVPEPSATAEVTSRAPSVDTSEASSAKFFDETDDGEPHAEQKATPRRFSTVQQAAQQSCTTSSVERLSRQIIEQARCIKPNAFVPLPARPNLVFGSSVFPYLERDARDHLLQVLDAHSNGKMTINSALRTVAQQYLVSQWARGKRCGVQLATRPGESNHETGFALDIAEPAEWRPALEAQQFHWLGTSDRVHFDYKHATPPHVATDILAFQTLWNRNHPKDEIAVDGHYSAATERRLKKAPAGGFPLGPTCNGAQDRP